MVALMLGRWIDRFLNRGARKGQARADGLRPRLEALEDRTLLSVTPVFSGAAGIESYWVKTIAEPDGHVLAVGRGEVGTSGWEFAAARFNMDGSLDKSFGNGGEVLTSLNSSWDQEAEDALVQPDGKIVLIGRVRYTNAPDTGWISTPGGIGVVRYNADGGLDASFGNGGEVLLENGGGASAAALQPDGKLIVVGTWGQTDFSAGAPIILGGLTVVRLNADGGLDAGFAQGGVSDLADGPQTPQFPAGAMVDANAVAVNADGTISVQGEAETLFMEPSWDLTNPSYKQTISILYNPDGSLDRNFGEGGIVVGPEAPLWPPVQGGPISSPVWFQPIPAPQQPSDTGGPPANPSPPPAPPADKVNFMAFSNAIAGPNGTIIEAGCDRSNGTDLVARFNADGSLDPTFGVGGVVTLPGYYALTSLLPGTDGTMVVAGGSAQGFALWRLDSDGSLDSNFGLGGEVQVSSGGHAYWSVNATPRDDGGLVVTAFDGGPGPAPRVTLAQFHADGSLDAFLVPGLTMLTAVPDHSAAPVQGGPAVSAPSPAAAPSASPVLPPLTTNVTGDPAPAVSADALPTESGAVPPVPTGGAPAGTGNADPFGTKRSGGGGDSPAADDQTTDVFSLPAADVPVDSVATFGPDIARLLPGVDPAGRDAVQDYLFALWPLRSETGVRQGMKPVCPPAAVMQSAQRLALAPALTDGPADGGAWGRRLSAFGAAGLGLLGATLFGVPADDAQRRRKRATAH